jgi:hypothetical protein
MDSKTSNAKLYDDAFALLDRANELLEQARVRHELSVDQGNKIVDAIKQLSTLCGYRAGHEPGAVKGGAVAHMDELFRDDTTMCEVRKTEWIAAKKELIADRHGLSAEQVSAARESLLDAVAERVRAAQPPGVDNARLAWIGGGTLFDELCGVDIHEKALAFADMAGREEPNANDLANAARYVIDAAMAEDSSPTKGEAPEAERKLVAKFNHGQVVRRHSLGGSSDGWIVQGLEYDGASLLPIYKLRRGNERGSAVETELEASYPLPPPNPKPGEFTDMGSTTPGEEA